MGKRGPQPDIAKQAATLYLRDTEHKTFAEIGSILSVSKERAWMIYRTAVNENGEKLSTPVNE